jgi:hypothetical protein
VITNLQRRLLPVPVETAGPILERIPDPDGGIWPSPPWPRLVLDHGLRVGSRGGHGAIRYTCVGYEPGRWARFSFDHGTGVPGYHEFVVRGVAGGTEVSHLIRGGPLEGRMRLAWPLVVRWLHVALLQDLLDNWERAATGTVRRPARWSPWVRVVMRFLRQRRAAAAGQPTASSQSRV